MSNITRKAILKRLCFVFVGLVILFSSTYCYLTSRSFSDHQYYAILDRIRIIYPLFAMIQFIVIALGIGIIFDIKNNILTRKPTLNYVLLIKKCNWCLLFSCMSSTAFFWFISRFLLLGTTLYNLAFYSSFLMIRILYIVFIVMWIVTTFLQVVLTYRNVKKLDYALTKNVLTRIKEIVLVITCAIMGLAISYPAYRYLSVFLNFQNDTEWYYYTTTFATIGLMMAFYLPTILYKKGEKRVRNSCVLFVNTLIQTLLITMLSERLHILYVNEEAVDTHQFEYDAISSLQSAIVNYLFFLTALLLVYGVFRIARAKIKAKLPKTT